MNAEELLGLVDFWPGRIILSAAELELFPLLASPATAAEVAVLAQTDMRATTRLLDALAALGVLAKQDGAYVLAEGLHDALLPGPGCILPAIQHRAVLWQSWSQLSEVVRTGLPAVEPYEHDERPMEQVQSFIGAMAVRAHKTAPETVVALDLNDVRTVLDIGGGPGVYAEEFLKAIPGSAATIIDLPRVCDIARDRLAETEYAGRLSFIPGEVLGLDCEHVLRESGGGYDLVFMSNLIHSMGKAQITELFTRALYWTRPGGRLAVKDFFLDDTRVSPGQAAVFSINMLVNTPEGASYTWRECEEMLTKAQQALGIACAAPERIMLAGSGSGMLVLRRVAE